jgi:hypothetical protein
VVTSAKQDLWLTLAQAVSDGTPVDWERVERQTHDQDESRVVRALRTIETIARLRKSLVTAIIHSPDPQ